MLFSQSVDLLREGKYEEIQKTLLKHSLKITTEQDLGQDYFDSFEVSYEKFTTRQTVYQPDFHC